MAHRRRFALLVSLLASAFLAAGCGSNDDSQDITGEPFSESNVIDFSTQLDNVQDLIAAGDCTGAVQKVDTLSGAVDGISSDVDQGLKDDLQSLLDKLGTQIGSECQETTPTTSSATTEDTDTVPTTTDETTTTETESTTTETDTTEEPPADEGDQGTGGSQGTPPGQGGTPPSQGGTLPGVGTDPGDSGGIAPRATR